MDHVQNMTRNLTIFFFGFSDSPIKGNAIVEGTRQCVEAAQSGLWVLIVAAINHYVPCPTAPCVGDLIGPEVAAATSSGEPPISVMCSGSVPIAMPSESICVNTPR